MDPFWGVTCAILVPGVLLASWIDYSRRRVPNWLNLALILSGFAVQGHLAIGRWGLSGDDLLLACPRCSQSRYILGNLAGMARYDACSSAGEPESYCIAQVGGK